MDVVNRIRIHHFERASRSNGPGWRCVLWLQGCTLGCPGCFNPLTHPSMGGKLLPIEEVVKTIEQSATLIEGVTFSGGEPLQQIVSLTRLIVQIRQKTNLSILLFTGYDWSEIQKMPRAGPLLAMVDVVIAGRYLNNQRIAHNLIGSRNKTVHFLTNRYTQADLKAVPEAEIILNANGEIIFSGIQPIEWNE